MKCLPNDVCGATARSLGLQLGEQGVASVAGRPPTSRQFKRPDSARRQALGVNRLFGELVEPSGEWLLWVLAWNVRPDEEYMVLVDQIRAFHGERRPLAAAPGHLFSREEQGLARGFMRLAILFSWTAYLIPIRWTAFLIPNPASHVVFINEEQMVLAAADGAVISELAEEIEGVWTKPW